jgi:5,5'-dehydrodivanillate O-demethylase oxygenase subunit
MMTSEENAMLTSVGPGTPMGELLRRYWHPVAATAEMEPGSVRPVRLLGEDFVLFRSADDDCGLLDRHCTHRRADLAFGFVDKGGLRCSYHGWCFATDGECISQPFEDVTRTSDRFRAHARTRAFAVREHAGLVFVYIGPEPVPLLPNWEPFCFENGFAQVVFSDVGCNWLQGQENAVDPVHFEWQHSNWLRVQRGETGYGPGHERIGFFAFEHGLGYHRLLSGEDEASDNWQAVRLCLFPNIFMPRNHLEWRVPVDDERTLSVIWHYTRVPAESEPYRQQRVPYWTSPALDEHQRPVTTHVINQDIIAWVGQGRIADRTKERLGRSDRGITMLRRALRASLEAVAMGLDPKGVFRSGGSHGVSDVISLPGERESPRRSRVDWLADLRALHTNSDRIFPADLFWLAYGQPAEVFEEFSRVAGLDPGDIREATGGRALAAPLTGDLDTEPAVSRTARHID